VRRPHVDGAIPVDHQYFRQRQGMLRLRFTLFMDQLLTTTARADYSLRRKWLHGVEQRADILGWVLGQFDVRYRPVLLGKRIG
jgi:hypothetical protein